MGWKTNGAFLGAFALAGCGGVPYDVTIDKNGVRAGPSAPVTSQRPVYGQPVIVPAGTPIHYEGNGVVSIGSSHPALSRGKSGILKFSIGKSFHDMRGCPAEFSARPNESSREYNGKWTTVGPRVKEGTVNCYTRRLPTSVLEPILNKFPDATVSQLFKDLSSSLPVADPAQANFSWKNGAQPVRGMAPVVA
jgi:hypothetical protein